MIVKRIRFKNIKSYGNKEQSITFDKPGLWLIHGTNGAGKSSIQDVFDITLFNIARGKNNNRIPLRNIVNRTNKCLESYIDFDNFRNDSIEIVRKVDPNDFSIKINEQNFTERFKLMNEVERENIIGFNYQTFRSFISLSMNDFLNFIDLKPEDKRNLLNRLFNLERIDDYLSITKELITQNKKEIERLSIEIVNIENEMKGYRTIIENSNGKTKLTKEELKKNGADTKKKYDETIINITELLNKISNFQVKIQEHKNYMSSANNENIKRKTELSDIKNKIRIFESGNCPYCNSVLDDDEHLHMLDELKITDEDLSTKIIENDKKISFFYDENRSIGQQSKVLEESKVLLDEQLIDLKWELKNLRKEIEEYEDGDNNIVDDLKSKGINLSRERKEKLNRISELRKDMEELTGLSKIFGDGGARRTIIASLIPPINHYLNNLLKFIDFPYEVKLNDNFDAEIYDKGETIHNETPSNGEIRMLNICIAISYIQMVRKMKNINILFMDEVFQSVQKDNINLLLNLLKNFAIENELHLILVHHGLEEVDPNYFNRIISVQKDMFSDMKIN